MILQRLFRLFAFLFLANLVAAQALIWPGEKMVAISGKNLRAFVPAAHQAELCGLVARADQIYGRMLADAAYQPQRKLSLLFGDFVDEHNGFSFVVPFPLVQVELAPALTGSTIFAGENEVERTLTHEFAHHISNDRNEGLRDTLAGVFGRVLPVEPLAALTWYLSTPAHQTMPAFWHEGLATWAETEYADPESPWAGRGRDPLVHMVWRLDAASSAIPAPEKWRLTQHRWPFGHTAYFYGGAYLRYLSGSPGVKAGIWQLAAAQSRSWPYMFSDGLVSTLGKSHGLLLAEARHHLQQEQEQSLARLRESPVTGLTRLTPEQSLVGAPAWLPGKVLAFAYKPHTGRPRIARLDRHGNLTITPRAAHARAGLRATPAGKLIYHEYNWRTIAKVHLGDRSCGWRLLQPDYRAGKSGPGRLVGIQFTGGGKRELVVQPVDPVTMLTGAKKVIPVEGHPWSPTFRPGTGGEVLWVETDGSGSRLVLATLENPEKRKVLQSCRGRILHPVWTATGAEVFYCADHTGVANAYCLHVATGRVQAVTNTLGGVVACVPAPDGGELALVDHDRNGPFIARIKNDPATWCAKPPTIKLAWPAPLPGAQVRTKPLPPANSKGADGLTVESYWGLKELTPLYWTPSTFVTPYGGYGVTALMADPLLTSIMVAGVGWGPVEGEPVGFLGYVDQAMPLTWGLNAWRGEATYGSQIIDNIGREFHYTETVDNLEFRLGRGLYGRERSFVAFATVGLADHDEVDEAADDYAGLTLVNTPAFAEQERYLQLTLGYGDATFFPTSYAPEDGLTAIAEFRHSGFGGDLERNRAFLNASYVCSILPEAGHQLVFGGQVGWSDGDRSLQGNFAIGGALDRGLPRGYLSDTQALGRHLLAVSAAYRLPLWRPFRGESTTPLRWRQVVLEGFFDAGKVSTNQPGGNGHWFASMGGELKLNMEWSGFIFSPGIGLAVQLDGDEDSTAYLTLGFPF